MKEIALTKGRVTIVDDSDYEVLSAYNWQFDVRGYAARTSGAGYPKRKHYRMHREVVGITDPNIHVDHINGNRLDNRRSNLRLCTNGENLRNRGAQKNNTSGFKGVCWNKDRNGWMAQISFQNKKHFLGVFKTPEEASSILTWTRQLCRVLSRTRQSRGHLWQMYGSMRRARSLLMQRKA